MMFSISIDAASGGAGASLGTVPYPVLAAKTGGNHLWHWLTLTGFRPAVTTKPGRSTPAWQLID
jgi:hypothetical protein